MCCTPLDLPSEVIAVPLNDLRRDEREELPKDGVFKSDQLPNVVEFNAAAVSCVRVDSLNIPQKTKLLASSSCNSFIVHEHTRCECTVCECQTNGVDFCNCPGGLTPEVNEPQNSLRSENEFIGSSATSCSVLPPNVED